MEKFLTTLKFIINRFLILRLFVIFRTNREREKITNEHKSLHQFVELFRSTRAFPLHLHVFFFSLTLFRTTMILILFLCLLLSSFSCSKTFSINIFERQKKSCSSHSREKIIRKVKLILDGGKELRNIFFRALQI